QSSLRRCKDGWKEFPVRAAGACESGEPHEPGCVRRPRQRVSGSAGDTFMRTLLQPLVMAACLLGPGCQFACEIRRNLIHEPLMACDEKQIHHRCIKLGKQAWNEMVRQYGDSFSCDYRRGFVDGFADYLFYGGCIGDGGCCAGQCGNGSAAGGSTTAQAADPGSYKEYPVCPAVPPERYRRKRFMTPGGCAAMEDWYAGVKHGAGTGTAW